MKRRVILDEGEVAINSLDGVKIDGLISGAWYFHTDDRGYRGLKRFPGRKVKIIAEIG